MNPEVKELFIKKAKFWKVVRSFFEEKQFVEVETPILEFTTGGAEARPFKTHHNDFDIDLYLRISVGELWQKRLIAGGFNKIFEIGKVFRNEGTSAEHLQEFTNLEFYWAFANYEKGMDLVKDLYKKIAQDVFGTTKFKLEKYEFDLADEWKKIDYHDEVLKQTGIDILSASEEEMKSKLKELQVSYSGEENKERLTDTLWKYCRKNIAGPAFLVNHPKLIAPLAKSKEGKPEVVDMFQPIIAGSEMGRGYSELNDPVDQKARFDKQQELLKAGDDEAMMLDDEFVEMLEHGMPPTCGFGFGERLFWTLAGVSAREGTLFPLMRPKE
jgi:lysyl-tRNA synthetase class 2